MTRYFPFLSWMRTYDRADLSSDVAAGITTAVMLVPQGMAYAMLAGLPPIVGLYASTLPLAAYALLGTSRQLAVGPVAMVSLMVAAATAEASAVTGADPLALALGLALLVGVLQAGLGLLRLGFVVDFLSHPVISGFTSAAALIIGASQLKHLLGVDLPRSHAVHEILFEAITHLPQVHGVTLGIGLGAMAILWGLRRLAPRVPAALVVVVLTTAATWLLGLDAPGGVKAVGEVPAGLPTPTLPPMDLDTLQALLPTAVLISFVGFMESISVAKAFAARHRYRVDPDQELIGLGIANLVASAFGGYPVTGGFSRTAVNDQAGARTPLASLLTAAFVALTLLFLTPLFVHLPKATLAAIVMVAVSGLVDLKTPRHLWQVDKLDFVVLVVTFVATLLLGIELGIAAGVGTSLAIFLRRRQRPHAARLGRVPGTTTWRNVARHEDLEVPADLAVLRVDASLWFGNAGFLRDQVEAVGLGSDDPPRGVVLDFSAVNDVDASAMEMLEHLAEDLHHREIALALVRVKGPVMDRLQRGHLPDHLGDDGFFETVEEAVDHLGGAAPAPTEAGPGLAVVG